MKLKRFTEEQIIGVLKESGVGVQELCRMYEMSDVTCYKWRQKYGGMEVNEARRLREVEDENRRLKRLVADLSLDNQMLRVVVNEKKNGEPSGRARGGAAAHDPVSGEPSSGLRVCRVLKLSLPTLRYVSRRGNGGVVRDRLRALAKERLRFGYRRRHVLLRREGYAVNQKCVYRFYGLDGLKVRVKRRKRVSHGLRRPLTLSLRANESWSMDFYVRSARR